MNKAITNLLESINSSIQILNAKPSGAIGIYFTLDDLKLLKTIVENYKPKGDHA